MAQTQAPASFYKNGRMRGYTPTVDTYPGDVVVIGSQAYLAANFIAANTLGAIHTDGTWQVPKDTSTFSDGDPVYWNATGNPVIGTAGTGCCTSTSSGNTLMGVADGAGLTGDQYLYVRNFPIMNVASIGGTMTAATITGSASTLTVTGLGAAQGGTVAISGGTSSTSGNAGGPLTLNGGLPGATGIGGAVTITGAIGGATSGAGGAVSMTGGAGTAGNAAGGAASLIGGLGQGSAAGGAITITSGAAGATGVAGAVNISVGAATAGAGSSMTLTAGNGAGGTAAGGNLNLVAGTAVSTGVPGEVQVNANSHIIPIQVALTATDASRAVYIATRAVRFKAVSYMHTTGSTSGTLQIEKLTGTTAAGSGTVLLTGTMDLSATTSANTVITGTLIATVASLTLAAGDRLGIKIGGTMTSLAGAIATLMVAPC
jgi:hypothetical protein